MKEQINAVVEARAQEPETDLVIVGHYREAQKLQEYAESRVIQTLDDTKDATNDLSIISKLKKEMEARRKEYVKPLQEQVKNINDNYKIWMAPIEAADKITRDKMVAFNQELERIQQEQEKINRLRIEAAQKEMELKGELTESVDLVNVIEVPKRTQTGMGTTGMKDCWKYQVFDFTQLPDEYKIVDSAMLNAITKKHHDQKSIPGVRFYNEPIIAVRAK